MAGVPLKFRCYRCNQLLGVARTKVGSTVSCPKCAAELLVPDPDEAVPVSEGRGGGSTTQDALDSGIPADLIDLRPEDIRVEPGVAWEPSAEAPRFPEFEGLAARPEEKSPPSGSEIPFPALGEETSAPASIPIGPTIAESPPSPPPEPIVPPIRLEPQKLAVHRAPVARSRDVVLPRSTVAAWSLFVLLAQGLAFLAGLLAGHFLWRVH